MHTHTQTHTQTHRLTNATRDRGYTHSLLKISPGGVTVKVEMALAKLHHSAPEWLARCARCSSGPDVHQSDALTARQSLMRIKVMRWALVSVRRALQKHERKHTAYINTYVSRKYKITTIHSR